MKDNRSIYQLFPVFTVMMFLSACGGGSIESSVAQGGQLAIPASLPANHSQPVGQIVVAGSPRTGEAGQVNTPKTDVTPDPAAPAQTALDSSTSPAQDTRHTQAAVETDSTVTTPGADTPAPDTLSPQTDSPTAEFSPATVPATDGKTVITRPQTDTTDVSAGRCPVTPGTSRFYVSLDGDDFNDGKSGDTAFATINHALEMAFPGDCILLAPGVYPEDIVTQRNGTADALIYLTSLDPSSPAIIKGSHAGRVFQLKHSYIHLSDFTIDGLHGDPADRNSYRNKLLFVHNSSDPNGITGVRIHRLTLRNAGGECLRFRYFVTHSEIASSRFSNCGVYDFKFDNGGKNGEAIYIGTSVNQWDDGKNPTSDPDQTAHNSIHHNIFNTGGNECVDIKEGSHDNLVYENDCTGQRDPESAGFSAAGNRNTFHDNRVYGNRGSGFRFGSNRDGYGIENIAYNNTVHDNQAYGMKIMDTPQGSLCGNTLLNNNRGAANRIASDNYQPESTCPP